MSKAIRTRAANSVDGVVKIAVWSIAAMIAVPAQAADHAPERRFYVGIFGGAGWQARPQTVRQQGLAYRRGDYALPGFRDFDLAVDVRGKSTTDTNLLAGVQLGYRFDHADRKLVPAVEIEGLFVSARRRSSLLNPSPEEVRNIGTGALQAGLNDPRDLIAEEYGAGRHRFDNRMRGRSVLLMTNAVLGYRLSPSIEPYLGIGGGLAIVTLDRAVSLQTNPFGPVERTSDTHEEVNHFNSDTSDTRVTYALQAKTGLRLALAKRVQAFGEYRFVHIGPTRHVFGQTAYPGHAPTDPWRLRSGPSQLHAVVVGLRFGF